MFCRLFSGRRRRRPLRGHWLGEIPLFFRDVMKSLPPRGRGTALAVEGACVTFDLHKFHCNALSLTRQGTPLRCVASFLAKTWSGAPSRREPFSGSVYGGSTRSPVRNPSAPLGHLPLHRGDGSPRTPTPTGEEKDPKKAIKGYFLPILVFFCTLFFFKRKVWEPKKANRGSSFQFSFSFAFLFLPVFIRKRGGRWRRESGAWGSDPDSRDPRTPDP